MIPLLASTPHAKELALLILHRIVAIADEGPGEPIPDSQIELMVEFARQNFVDE